MESKLHLHLTPDAINDKCIADVPLETKLTNFDLVIFEIFLLNFPKYSP